MGKGKTIGWLRIFLIVTLVIGVFFRFYNIDKKFYWYDEAFTSLRISGYTKGEYVEQSFNGEIIGVEDLLQFQHPNSEKSLFDTIYSLTGEIHPPPYFVLTRFWMQLFGDSIAVTRSLAAIFALLALPSMYWLCRELFESPLVAWVGMALIAVSPYHVLFAQEARPYSLMTLTVLVSSASLLYALRRKTKFSWFIYTFTLALGFYTHLYLALVALGHGIYTLIIEKFRFTKNFIAYLFASLASLLAFSPWIWVILTNLKNADKITASAQKSVPLFTLVKGWFANLGQVFIDVGLGIIFAPIILVLAAYSIYFLCRNSPKRVWLFILTLIGTTALITVFYDLVFGGKASLRSRYLTTCYLGIEIAVAYLIATNINSLNFSRQKIWSVVMTVLISGGIISCAVNSQAEVWWNQTTGRDNPKIARIINSAEAPLLISKTREYNDMNILSLSHLLDPKVKFKLVRSSNMSKVTQIPEGFSDIFLYNPPEELKQILIQKYTLELIDKRADFWRAKFQ